MRLTQRLTGTAASSVPCGMPAAARSSSRTGISVRFRPSRSRRPWANWRSARPLLGVLTDDPSLRGAMKVISFGLGGVRAGRVKLDDLARPMTCFRIRSTMSLAGRFASFSWHVLLNGKAEPRELRRFIEVEPVLDFTALEPGGAAADRDQAGRLRSQSRLGIWRARPADRTGRARRRGIRHREGRRAAERVVTILAVLLILWLALQSARIILAVFVSLMIGLAITAALGLMMVGAFNLISVAFAVLFVGLGVDFGIQFSVRYRAERHENNDLRKALRRSAAKAGIPLIARRRRGGGGIFLIPADRLSRIVGTRIDRRRRHDCRIRHQHHRIAGAALRV